jgi:hypothetical protein
MDRLALVTDTCSHQAGLLVLIACFKDRELTHTQSIYSLLGLRIPCHSRWYPGVPIPPPSEIFLPTDAHTRYADHLFNYLGFLRSFVGGKVSTLSLGNKKGRAMVDPASDAADFPSG